ncbi:uncharacterized protein LOC128883944 isoform X2 [Hylaeus volcanicus]|uniref:uncharacterized protein LOC128883944 isoform X2 n=1 Tax=Hylaeus volcanicus TaxID=313075 RepID=UPI0023B81B4A|nr:uncharacterized protein LOC128883944 isoform X2 [Hylaeus volcanicus]
MSCWYCCNTSEPSKTLSNTEKELNLLATNDTFSSIVQNFAMAATKGGIPTTIYNEEKKELCDYLLKMDKYLLEITLEKLQKPLMQSEPHDSRVYQIDQITGIWVLDKESTQTDLAATSYLSFNKCLLIRFENPVPPICFIFTSLYERDQFAICLKIIKRSFPHNYAMKENV